MTGEEGGRGMMLTSSGHLALRKMKGIRTSGLPLTASPDFAYSPSYHVVTKGPARGELRYAFRLALWRVPVRPR